MSRRGRRITRGVVLLTAGLVGIGLETFYSLHFHETPDSALLLLFSAMIGLPFAQGGDDLHRRKRGKDDDNDDESQRGGRHVE